MNEANEVKKAIYSIVLSVPTLIISPIWKGYVLSVLWGWFISKTFSLPELSIPLAMGLSMCMALLTKQHVHTSKADSLAEANSRLISSLGHVWLTPLAALLLGFIVKQFI